MEGDDELPVRGGDGRHQGGAVRGPAQGKDGDRANLHAHFRKDLL